MDSLKKGDRVGDFTISRQVRRWLECSFYEAEDLSHRQEVTVAIFAEGSKPFDQRLLRLATHIQGTPHENIAKIYASGVLGELPYIVMERLPADSLEDLLPRGERNLSDVLKVVGQICEALAFAHQHGVLYRNLTPRNILLDSDLRVKLVDFGLISEIASEESADSRGFISPERRRGEVENGRSDVWSAGFLLSLLLTRTADRKELLNKGFSPSLMDTSRVTGNHLHEVLSLLANALAFDPSRRYSADEMSSAIAALRGKVQLERSRGDKNWVAGQAAAQRAAILRRVAESKRKNARMENEEQRRRSSEMQRVQEHNHKMLREKKKADFSAWMSSPRASGPTPRATEVPSSPGLFRGMWKTVFGERDTSSKQLSQEARPAPENASVVRVFYGTDRLQIPVRNGVGYAGKRSLWGKVHYGECRISIPTRHKTGMLETPCLLYLEFRPNPEKHIVLTETLTFVEEQFFERVRQALLNSDKKETFVFVHGYNVSFADAARRTGQMAFDLNFADAPIFYSWPSHAKVADYLKDETNVAWSIPHFERFLHLLMEKTGTARIHVIAHSMGNRLVCEALRSMTRNFGERVALNHLVLAAPDLDAETFVDLAAGLRPLTQRITLYESKNDRALQASKRIHGYARAGEPLLLVQGVDTIDASAVDTDFLGHSYFSDNWPLLSDIHSLLAQDLGPESRFGLVAIGAGEEAYHAFKR